MLASALLAALALLPAASAPDGGPQVFDLGIEDSEPHLRHRFVVAVIAFVLMSRRRAT